jgi:transposase
VSGIKRHIVVDTQGFLHAVVVTTADWTDRNGALELFRRHGAGMEGVLCVLVDGGYSGEPFALSMADLLPQARVEVVKRSEAHTFAVLPKRWIVERSFGCLLILSSGSFCVHAEESLTRETCLAMNSACTHIAEYI